LEVLYRSYALKGHQFRYRLSGGIDCGGHSCLKQLVLMISEIAETRAGQPPTTQGAQFQSSMCSKGGVIYLANR
jgi:hypothetical protein